MLATAAMFPIRKRFLQFIEQTIKVTGCTRFVIDTLHRVIVAKERENMVTAEGRVVKELEAFGVKYGTIFILIGQSNKEGESIKEQRHDSEGVLRGSRELIGCGLRRLSYAQKAQGC